MKTADRRQTTADNFTQQNKHPYCAVSSEYKKQGFLVGNAKFASWERKSPILAMTTRIVSRKHPSSGKLIRKTNDLVRSVFSIPSRNLAVRAAIVWVPGKVRLGLISTSASTREEREP